MNLVDITSLDHNGRGIGKVNNKIIFIENTLPNETVSFKVIKDKKNYLEGNLIKIFKKSNDRITPICPYYEECGGCNLMHTNYDFQLNFKEKKIKNIFNKYLNSTIKINKIIRSDKNINYRNKVTFQVDKKIGFYKRKSNDIVYINKCFLIDNKINDIIDDLNKLDLESIKSITCRCNENDIMVVISVKNKINESSVINTLKDKCTSIIINYKNNFKCIYGNNYIINTIGDKYYFVTNDGFFQINKDITYKLYSKIKEYSNLTGNETVLDLYCGSGTIGIFLSDMCKKVIGVEINKYSIECAKKNLKLNNINNCEFICDSTDNISLNINPDIIILDPPRSGLSKKAITDIISFKAKKIIYVSCDPMTLVRDLNLLNEYYDILEITPFDMFPNTHHVECISVLHRKNLKNI